MLTLQQIFDKALAGVRQQGGPARNADGDCAYRTELGLACGVGHLIPDSHYDHALDHVIDGLPVSRAAKYAEGTLTVPNPEARTLYEVLKAGGVDLADPTTRRLVVRLQSAHDKFANMDSRRFFLYWEVDMEQVAREFHLEYAQPERRRA